MTNRLTRRLVCEDLDQRLLLTANVAAAEPAMSGLGIAAIDGGTVDVAGPSMGLESTDSVQGEFLPGDANQDGRFDQTDVVQVLAAAKYLTGQPATWAEGDWNGDHVFDQQDLIAALHTGTFADGSFLAQPGFGELYHNGEVVRTLVPPASMPKPGVDNLYAVPGQLAVAAVAPGDTGYHGGKWAFHSVSWNVTPYTLTSEADVLAAESAGDVDITRIPEMDFKCPIQP